MTTLQMTGSVLRASADDRIVTYLLCPFGEPGRTSLGKVTLTASSLTIPEDVTSLAVNVEHDPKTPVGRFARIEATAAGLEADVRFLATRAGDDALTEAREGVRRGISVEVDNPVIRQGQMRAGLLSGAGVCVEPAYPSALMVASDAGELPDYLADTESTSESTEEVVIDGVTYVRKTTSNYKTETTPKERSKGDDDAEQSAEEEEEMGNSLTAAAPAQAPLGLHAAGNATEKKGPQSLGAFSKMLASAFQSGGENKMLAALTDITHDDGDNDGDGLGEITAPQGWLGNVWNEALYERVFIPLIASGTLTSWREQGFRWATKPTVAPYAGNKAAVPSTGMTATPVTYGTQRWANAADIDRRYVDFGDSDLIASWIEANVDSYKEVTDLDVGSKIIAGASAGTWSAVVGVPDAISAIVQLSLQLIAARLQPSFAIVGLDVYEPLLYVKKDDVSAFLTESFGLKNGLLDKVTIVPTSEAAYLGNVVVGDGRTIRFKEMGGVPIRVEAENIGNGGRDIGVFGYTSFQQLKPGGVRKVDVTP
jgi:hypothetical protein